MNDYNDNIIYSDGNEVIDENNRQYFRTKCKFEKMFPNYSGCPGGFRNIDRNHCSYLLNCGQCMCDDMTDDDDWREMWYDLSDEELAELSGMPLDNLRRDAAAMEKYLGLTD